MTSSTSLANTIKPTAGDGYQAHKAGEEGDMKRLDEPESVYKNPPEGELCESVSARVQYVASN